VQELNGFRLWHGVAWVRIVREAVGREAEPDGHCQRGEPGKVADEGVLRHTRHGLDRRKREIIAPRHSHELLPPSLLVVLGRLLTTTTTPYALADLPFSRVGAPALVREVAEAVNTGYA
jgi:hypothetical protein